MCGEESIALPFDALAGRPRNFGAPFGALNSYYDAAAVRLERALPVDHYYRAYLETRGVLGQADVYADGAYLDSVTHTAVSLLPLGRKTRTVAYRITAANTGRYTGCGIGDGAALHYTESKLFIPPYGVQVAAVPGEKAAVTIQVELVNETGAPQKAVLTAEAYSARGKRLTRKSKTVRIADDTVRVFPIKAAMSRYDVWPNGGAYTLKVTVTADGYTDECTTVFGVTDGRTPVPARLMPYDNGMLGHAAYPTAESRKLQCIRDAGHDVVATPFPRESTLTAADRLGIGLIVRPFERLREPAMFGRPDFDRDRDEIISALRAIGNHPCVLGYELPAGALGDELAEEIRAVRDKPILRATDDAGCWMDFAGSAETGRYNDGGLFDATCVCKNAAADGQASILVTPPDGTPVAAWNFPRLIGQTVTVEVFTAGEVVSLLLDGRQIARKLAGKANGGKATFTVEYQPGTLEAVCLHRGFEQARVRLGTPDAPRGIRVTPETKVAALAADGLAFFRVEVTDAAGNVYECSDRTVTVEVSGEGRLVALGTGNPGCVNETGNTVSVYRGRALAVVQATAAGRVSVKVTGEGLKSGRASVKSK